MDKEIIMTEQTTQQNNPPLRFKQADGTDYPDWRSVRLGDVFTFETATSKSKYIENDGKYLIADMGAVSEQGNLIANKQTNHDKDILDIGDLIMPKDDIGTGLIIGKVAMIDQENKYICGDHVFKIIFNNLEYSPYFLKSLFNSTINNKKIKKVCQGSPILGLGKENLKSVSVLIPTKDEQQKIAGFLSVVDKRIALLQAKYDNLQKYKTGILQKIFTREKYFPEYKDSIWKTAPLETYLTERKEKNKESKYTRVLTVNNKKGVILQTEQFIDKRVASKDVSTYKIVYKNDIVYNPSRINVGSIGRLTNFDMGIVSPMYVVFSIDTKKLNIQFFEYVMQLHNTKEKIKNALSGSVRDSLKFDALCDLEIPIPELDEQKKIADFLSALDEKITKTQTQITKTKSFKSGLLQKMFI